MSKATRVRVLALSFIALFGGLTASSEAVTWHNSGTTAFTGTGAPGDINVTGSTVGCTGATTTGTVPAVTSGLVYTSSGTVTFSGCTLGGVPWTVDCSYVMTGSIVHGSGMGSSVTGVTDVNCSSYQFGANICRTSGTITGTYANTVPAVFSLTTGGSLVITNGAAGNCPLGNGDPVHLAGRTQTVTATNPPTITRTA